MPTESRIRKADLVSGVPEANQGSFAGADPPKGAQGGSHVDGGQPASEKNEENTGEREREHRSSAERAATEALGPPGDWEGKHASRENKPAEGALAAGETQAEATVARLSLCDPAYRRAMYKLFNELGPRSSGETKEFRDKAVEDILDRFKHGGGKLSDNAKAKIRADLRRRNETKHLWYKPDDNAKQTMDEDKPQSSEEEGSPANAPAAALPPPPCDGLASGEARTPEKARARAPVAGEPHGEATVARLSLCDPAYRRAMYKLFNELGPRRSDETKEFRAKVVEDMLDKFKHEGENHMLGKYSEKAKAKIEADLRRRNATKHVWYQPDNKAKTRDQDEARSPEPPNHREAKDAVPPPVVQLFALDVMREGRAFGGRPTRRPLAPVRYDPAAAPSAPGPRVGEGFACPRCAATCSYVSRQCKECSLECSYEAGVGVVLLGDRQGDKTAPPPWRGANDGPPGATVGRKRQRKESHTKDKASQVLEDVGSLTLDERWELYYQKLVEFKDKEGHCNVPYRRNKSKDLGNWVRHQRKAYKHYGGTLPFSRAVRLENIGFVWSFQQGNKEDEKKVIRDKDMVHSKDVGETTDERWEEHYRELLQFSEEEGHCNIPRGNTKFKSLSNWVRSQRTLYKRSGGALTGNRVARLESIGFTWKTQRGEEEEREKSASENGGLGLTNRNEKWEQQFQKLLKFKNEQGHCNVPTRTARFKSLRNWVRTQRTHYRRMQGVLAGNRVARLESIGFAWKIDQDNKEEEEKEASKHNGAVAKDAAPVTDTHQRHNSRELVDCRSPRDGQGNIDTLEASVHNQGRACERNGGTLVENGAVHVENEGLTLRQREEKGSDAGDSDAAATGHAVDEDLKVARRHVISEEAKMKYRRELISEVDCLLDSPSFGAREMESFKKGVQELAKNFIGKEAKIGAGIPHISHRLLSRQPDGSTLA